MKHKLLLFLLLISISVIGQNEVYFFKDTLNLENPTSLIKTEFSKVSNDIVIDSKSDVTFWFKIPKSSDNQDYVFYIRSIDVTKAKGFQENRFIEKLPNQRYTVFKFNRDADVYIKAKSLASNVYPLYLMPYKDFDLRERKVIMYNGFYYGFSILVILYSLVYFFFFKDYTYLYYSFFLVAITLGIFIVDGSFNLLLISRKTVSYLIVLDYIILAFFASKFVNSFLFLDHFYPNLKKYTYAIGTLITGLGISYLFTRNYEVVFVTFSILVYLLLFIYWITCLVLFKKNTYVKILVFAFALLLFSSINSIVLTIFGFYLFDTNPLFLKIGGLIQIIVLWLAVIFREKDLRTKNKAMKKEIISFSDAIKKQNGGSDSLNKLSFREKEIFDLIVQGESNKMIAEKLNISVNTVKFHIKKIYDKLQIKSRREVVNFEAN